MAPASTSSTCTRLLRVVPTLMLIGASQSAWAAVAAPTVTMITPAASTSSTNDGTSGNEIEFEIKWSQPVFGWDPLSRTNNGAAIAAGGNLPTDLRVYVGSSGLTSGANPLKYPDNGAATDAPLTIPAGAVKYVDANTVRIKLGSATFGNALTGALNSFDKVWVHIPANAVRGADLAYGAADNNGAFFTPAATNYIYQYISGGPDITAANTSGTFTITAPAGQSATTSRKPAITVGLDLSNAANKYAPTDTMTLKLYDGATVVATQSFLFGTPTANTSVPYTLIPSTELDPGVHTFNVKIFDPAGNFTAVGATKAVLIWDAQTVTGLDPATNKVTFTSTQNLTLSGSAFDQTGASGNAANNSVDITLTIDGVSQTVTRSGTSSNSKGTAWSASIASLTASSSHTAVLTQTARTTNGSGNANNTGTNGWTAQPSIITTFTIDNSSALDVTAPTAPAITAPVPNAVLTATSGVAATKPTVTITGCEANSTVTLEYSTDNGTTYTALTGVTKTADATGTVTWTPANWTTASASLTGGSGTYALRAKCTDAAGNISSYSPVVDGLTVAATTILPTITVQSTSASYGGSDPWAPTSITYASTNPIIFQIDVASITSAGVSSATDPDNAGTASRTLTASDFTVSGGTLVTTSYTVPNSGTQVTGTALGEKTASHVYYLAVTPTSSTVSVGLNANVFTVSSAANIASNTLTVGADSTKPSISGVTVASGTSSTATNTAPIVTISFSEPMQSTNTFAPASGSVNAGYNLNGFTSGVKWANDGKSVQFKLQSVAAGTTTVVAASGITTGMFHDLAGNVLSAAAPSTAVSKTVAAAPSWSISYDPAVAVPANVQVTTTVSSSTATKTNPIPFAFTFPSTVTGFSLSNLTITNGIAASTGITGSGTTYALNVIPGEGSTAVNVVFANNTGITDDKGSTGIVTIAGSGISRVYDSTSPRVVSFVSTVPTSGTTNKTTIPCAVTFSEPVSGLTAAKFSVENCTVSGLSPSTGSSASFSFNLAVSGATAATKTVKCIVPGSTTTATTASDAAGNLSGGYAMKSWSYDGVVPTFTGSAQAAADSTGLSTATFRITPSKSLVTFDVSKLSVSGGSIGVVTRNGGGPYTSIDVNVSFPNIANGLVTLNVGAGAGTDAAGNATAAFSYDLPNTSDG